MFDECSAVIYSGTSLPDESYDLGRSRVVGEDSTVAIDKDGVGDGCDAIGFGTFVGGVT